MFNTYGIKERQDITFVILSRSDENFESFAAHVSKKEDLAAISVSIRERWGIREQGAGIREQGARIRL